jgi:hypothetical protein
LNTHSKLQSSQSQATFPTQAIYNYTPSHLLMPSRVGFLHQKSGGMDKICLGSFCWEVGCAHSAYSTLLSVSTHNLNLPWLVGRVGCWEGKLSQAFQQGQGEPSVAGAACGGSFTFLHSFDGMESGWFQPTQVMGRRCQTPVTRCTSPAKPAPLSLMAPVSRFLLYRISKGCSKVWLFRARMESPLPSDQPGCPCPFF